MPYVSSSAPLPTNSLTPQSGPINTDELARDAEISRSGRERVYANMPTAASFYCENPGLAVDANQRIGESEQSRQAILTGIGVPNAMLPEPTLAQIQASAPRVSSLNGSPTSGAGLDSSQAGLMPAPAPQEVLPGIFGSAKLPGGGTGQGQRGVLGQLRHGAMRRNQSNLGPGCDRFPESPNRMLLDHPVPPNAANPLWPAPVVQMRSDGVNGYSPDWGGAFASGDSGAGQPVAADNSTVWLWLLAGGALLGIAASGKTRGWWR